MNPNEVKREVVLAMGQCTFCHHAEFIVLLDKQFKLSDEEQTRYSDSVLQKPLACHKCVSVKDDIGLAWGFFIWTVCFNMDMKSLVDMGLRVDLSKSTRGLIFGAPLLVSSILRAGAIRRKATSDEIQLQLKMTTA